MKKLLLFILVLGLVELSNVANAQYHKLLDFNGTNGAYPQGSLTLSGNVLYGMIQNSGKYGDGNIFSINTDGSKYNDLLDLAGINEVGCGSLTFSGSVLYGMTYQGGEGGAYGDGVIFSINTDGSGYNNLLYFNDTNGTNPVGSLILPGSVLYGMTRLGGVNGDGVIFSINTDGSGYKDLLDFNGKNGSNPYGSLILSGSVLYGMTQAGGIYGVGNIFSINTDGSGYIDLLDFNGTNGDNPLGSLTISGSELYGMTRLGGANGYGVIFSINTDGSGYKDLLDFNSTNGSQPYGSLTLSGSVLYGMTQDGGVYGDGVIFSINTDGSGYNDLMDFNRKNGANGANPLGSLTLSGNVLYGMTQDGGEYNYGVIFSYNLNNVGIHQLAINNEQLTIYPNPANDKLTIESPNEATIEFSNIQGQMIKTLASNSNKTTIDMSSFARGMYFIRVKTDKEITIKKFIKE